MISVSVIYRVGLQLSKFVCLCSISLMSSRVDSVESMVVGMTLHGKVIFNYSNGNYLPSQKKIIPGQSMPNPHFGLFSH